MRLSDGLIYESEWGVIIRLESESIAFGQIVTWPFLMIANGDRDRVNKIFLKKIEQLQKKMRLYHPEETNDRDL